MDDRDLVYDAIRKKYGLKSYDEASNDQALAAAQEANQRDQGIGLLALAGSQIGDALAGTKSDRQGIQNFVQSADQGVKDVLQRRRAVDDQNRTAMDTAKFGEDMELAPLRKEQAQLGLDKSKFDLEQSKVRAPLETKGLELGNQGKSLANKSTSLGISEKESDLATEGPSVDAIKYLITTANKDITQDKLAGMSYGQLKDTYSKLTGRSVGVPLVTTTDSFGRKGYFDKQTRQFVPFDTSGMVEGSTEEREKTAAELWDTAPPATRKSVKEAQDSYNKDDVVKKARSQLSAVADTQNLVKAARGGTKVDANVFATKLARLSGEVGNMAEHDKRGFGGEAGIISTLDRILAGTKVTGEVRPEDLDYVEQLTSAMSTGAMTNLKNVEVRYLETIKTKTGLGDKDAAKLFSAGSKDFDKQAQQQAPASEEMIRVRNKETGKSGKMPKSKFDPKKYEVIQ